MRLSDDQLALRQLAGDVARARFAEHAKAWDRDSRPLSDVNREALGSLDLLGLTLPTEVGGMARPLLDGLIVLEEIAKVSQIAAWPVFEACTGAARVVAISGTEEQQQRFLPPIVQGEEVMAVAISEPEAGSAATDLTTYAELDGEHVVISGVKRWCSGAGYADSYLVYCRLGPGSGASGVGAVVVDGRADGLTIGPQQRLMGFHGIGTADLTFDGVRVHKGNIIAAPGSFGRLFGAFSIERLGNATMSLAIAQRALDEAHDYVNVREQFGRPVSEFQMVQSCIADMVMNTKAARLLIYEAATNADRGIPSALEASIAKCFSNEAAKRVSDLAIQLHGAYGYSEELDLERLHRDAHGWAIAGGTTNMQRMRIASEFLGRRFPQRRTTDEKSPSAAPSTAGARQ
jgi:alkylation response protein AidB-like acyl-CoA dehydrogenase